MAYVDLYCERIEPGLLAEPVNAATNAAFFLVAWALWRFARRTGPVSGDIGVLLALVVAIGIGSTLFHTFATTWARVLDELPILIFQLVFIGVYARRVIGLRRWSAGTCVAAFLVAALYGRQFPQMLNGSLVYAPAFLMMLGLGIYHGHRQKPGRWLLLGAFGVLTAALWLRTLDAAVCEQFALGTHFLWHLLVSAVSYLCLRALLEQHPQAVIAPR